MQFTSKFNRGIRFNYVLMTFIVNIHAFFSLKYKKGITITNVFQKI